MIQLLSLAHKNKLVVVLLYHNMHAHIKDLEQQQYSNCLPNIKKAKHYKHGLYNLNKSLKITIKQRENNSKDTNLHTIACMSTFPEQSLNKIYFRFRTNLLKDINICSNNMKTNCHQQ